jgi:recombination protein RecR
MSRRTTGPEIERLIQLLAKLPGLGPRSARRAALHLIKNRERLLVPIASAMAEARDKVTVCTECGNVDTVDPCTLCTDPRRERAALCVVEEVGDLWALERAGAWNGIYHVLGGTLSAIEGVRPEDLAIGSLLERAAQGEVKEVVIALNATVDGQTTAHYIADALSASGVSVTSLAQGVPIGGELDYLDDGTLGAALRARKSF